MNELYARLITGTLLAGAAGFIYYFCPPVLTSIILYSILGLILVYEWPRIAQRKKWLWAIMPLYPVAPFIVLAYINESYHALLMPLFILTCAFDSAAYFCGKRFGRHKLMPRISPGKTWEGLIGGTIITMLIATGMHFLCSKQAWLAMILFTIGICISAVIGDLVESWLKRSAKIKDAGELLPGHGGLLDRFDSIMATALYFVLFKKWAIALFC
jgi:phosphatidate cytidylyltransferase